jgi:hypothetical protein
MSLVPSVGQLMVDSTTALSAKRNRSGVCPNPEVHPPHQTCPGRKRAAKIARPADSNISAALEEVWRKFGGHWLQADPEILGILSPADIAQYGLDLEAYEEIPFVQMGKFISFFTVVHRTNAIILEYAAQDLLPLTLRQIHYQMVVRHKGDYPNTKTSYTHMYTDLVTARMAGLVPWNAIDDPTRGLHSLASWDSVENRLFSAANSHRLNRWGNQAYRPIVLVEKDAALGIISRVCDGLDVPYISLKGYGSTTALRNDVAHYCRRALNHDKVPVVIHISDHDASGWDMPRSLGEYLDLFVGQKVDVRHVALTLDQITEGYGNGEPLPPDPVKPADPRAKKYIEHLAERGLEPGAWELDALPPAVLHDVISDEIKLLRDEDLWQEVEEHEQEQKRAIQELAERWSNPLPNAGESA